jgi:Sulfotransferase family
LLRHWLHRFVPSHFRDPVGLARRLLRTGDPAALFAMQTALLGVAAAPLDRLLQFAETRRYRNAPAPRLPLIFICGAPRSGTTLVEQVLIQQLPVAFINNLTAIFPRAPLTANRLFRPATRRTTSYHNFYGKTEGLAGPNDGLHLWDRWLGADRMRTRTSLTPQEQRDMRRFFGAMEQLFGKPILTKNNNLNACASLVAEVFDQAVFICMTREPLYLAQSLLRARSDIHGGEDVPYGLTSPAASASDSTGVIEDVCRQALYHERLAQEQRDRIGPRRFWTVRYETFCQDPSALVEAVAVKVLGQPPAAAPARLPPFAVSNAIRMDPSRFAELAATLERLGHAPPDRS